MACIDTMVFVSSNARPVGLALEVPNGWCLYFYLIYSFNFQEDLYRVKYFKSGAGACP
jgi:hypothetical protein